MSKKIFKISLYLCVVALLFARGLLFLDPDFGWHLKLGELITQSGIPETDPFSYTMPSYPLVDHEWLSNVSLYFLHQFLGIPGLVIIWMMMVLGTVWIAASIFKTKTAYKGEFILLTLAALLPFWGVRTQVEGWLFLAILLKLVLDQQWWRRYKYVTPLVFLVWANLHGSFAAGIAVLLFVIVGRTWTTKKFLLMDLGITFLSIGATFINPYGWRLWWDIWMELSYSQLHATIEEWKPGYLWLDVGFVTMIAFSVVIIKLYWHKFSKVELGLFLALLSAALLTQRHIPLWVVLALPVCIQGYSWFAQQMGQQSLTRKRFLVVHKYFGLFAATIFLFQGVLGVYSGYILSERSFYPQQAVEYLKTHPISGQLFSPYGWGGYLIWNYPDHTVFVNGLMPTWRWQTPNSRESGWAFQDYVQVTTESSKVDALFQKYQISTVLWESENKRGVQNIWNMIAGILGFHTGSNKDIFLEHLESSGWKEVYRDSTAVIYQL